MEIPSVCMTDGRPVTQDHTDLDQDSGQQKGYVVLCPEERDKGYVRPLRTKYIHTTCGALTTMHLSIAETYARDPSFYGGTFCSQCREHFPLPEFTWEDGSIVGS